MLKTQNLKITLELEPSILKQVQLLAKQNRLSLADAAKDLIREACVDIEDWGLSYLAQERLAKIPHKKLIKHQNFWK